MDQSEQGHRPPPPPPPPQPGTPPGGHPGFGPPPPPYAPPAAPPQPYAQPPQPYAQPPQPYGQSAQPYPQPPQPYGQPAPPAHPYPYTQPPAGEAPLQGPEFMAVDRHNSVVVDVGGVAFEDHGVSVDFPWPEIRSVHYKASGNGKALMVAVIHADGTFFECSVEAKPRERLHQWFAHLAQVLGHYRPTG
ncbi:MULTISPECIES: hypothetical protein [Streptomyces]|uniref:Uncharacterized protein n=1 Tax=Streptomyces bottropensis ATCC 25435 TaxID=1054862 RepID=M3FR48_9ACTN|nr:MULTISPECIES: hypothetical protein [Streptomyces]EMF54604.1 hypothetical protein SBD_4272 [Streptomyces bottropensis ATCC 25435]MZD19879.1 hypothetical protein [Streptomyces sp. SID5476]